MKILITGANGYIGKRIIEPLLKAGHEVYCAVRNKGRFHFETKNDKLHVIEIDLEDPAKLHFPEEIEIAYYLVHSMRQGKEFEKTELKIASDFLKAIEKTSAKQIIYLSGIVNAEELSPHLRSRLAVEKQLRSGRIPVTVLRAGIVVGSGSSSFEIIRDLVEKLPVMITPKWLKTKCQPIGVRNVIEFLTRVLNYEPALNKDFDIGGPDVLTYKQMLMQFAELRNLKRKIITLPVMTPKLSSYWLYFVTSTTYQLAVNLVDSMKVDVVCRPNDLAEKLGVKLLTYKESVGIAFQKIEQNEIVSSWKNSFSAFNTKTAILSKLEVPEYGCFKDQKKREIPEHDLETVFNNIWTIGDSTGWYYGNILWQTRGFIDKFFGGVGLRKGRTHRSDTFAGDSVDFWRVLVADRQKRRLLLFAEMKVPGEAWLEFKICREQDKFILYQTATFRPHGITGRLYWYSMLPFHLFLFKGMIRNISKANLREVSPA
ncbi:MAG: SDR family oxidoreductase [Flavitalea sp.]